MKKILPVILVLLALALTQGCAVKRGLGFVNNALTVRDDYGSVQAELSAGVNIQNYFSDYTNLQNNYYHEQENGQVLGTSEVGLGVYYKLYSGNVFTVSAGLKYFDYITYNYNYIYYYERTNVSETYDYQENITVDYFNSNKVSVMFPDVEIKLPFGDNLRMVANLELVYLKWYYTGGYYRSTYEQKLDKQTGNTTPADTFGYVAPGKVTSVTVGSGLFYLGTVNFGILYYF
jgi:hypothetical protein